ncbi:hypothetical protein BC835DRAFT_1419139 [Cytidiella melzeri]|nr:hypothetical protein BC835DRAFT_1419139 [Cytidiella melzeri]
MAPSVLLIGLPWQGVPDPELQKTVREGLEKMDVDIPGAGYDYHTLLADPKDGEKAFTDGLTSRKWDVVIVGFGLRGFPQFTVFFEWLVNEIKDKAPTAKIGFNSSPESTLDSAKRLAPV